MHTSAVGPLPIEYALLPSGQLAVSWPEVKQKMVGDETDGASDSSAICMKRLYEDRQHVHRLQRILFCYRGEGGRGFGGVPCSLPLLHSTQPTYTHMAKHNSRLTTSHPRAHRSAPQAAVGPLHAADPGGIATSLNLSTSLACMCRMCSSKQGCTAQS